MIDAVRKKVRKAKTDGQLELVEHLSELRSRILRCLTYVVCGMIIGWAFYSPFFKLLSAPVVPHLQERGSTFLLTGVAEGFTIKVQVSLLVGIILALPLITLEGWRFISPGLTPAERRAVKLVSPLSIILFGMGIVLAYFVMPMGIRWLLAQNPPEATFMPSVAQTLLFILKMYIAFGVVFQMPVILMFLAKVGLVSSSMLKSYWRHAVVGIGIIAAMITPSGDAFTMMTMCVPMIILYVLSIGLVQLMEK